MELTLHLANLRQRLGEVQEGFWTDAELTNYLNQAQRLVAQHVHSREHPYQSAMQWRVPVTSGAEFYVMEEDYLDIKSVAHFRSANDIRRLIEADLTNLRLSDQYYGDYQYRFYQMRGRTNLYIAQGQATGGGPTTLQDTDQNFTNLGVRVGDIVYNESDSDASAIVTAVATTELTINNWSGGVGQRFQVRDGYRIAQPERTRNQMFVYPIIRFDPPLADFSGNGPWVLRADTVVTAINVRFLRADPQWLPDTQLSVELRVSTPSPTLLQPTYAIDSPRVGDNTVLGIDPVHLQPSNPGTTTLSVQVNFGSHIYPTVDYEVTVQGYQQTIDNFLQVDYTPYPRPMQNTRSICELEQFLYEPMLRKAKQLAYEKQQLDNPMIITLENEYQRSIQESKDLLRIRGGVGRNNERNEPYSLPWEDQGLTLNYGPVSDLPWW